MRIRNLALVLALAGTTFSAAALYAVDDKNETPAIQHLRAARKSLNEAKDAFEKDPADSANHRKEILEGIDKAVNSIDLEIEELKKM